MPANGLTPSGDALVKVVQDLRTETAEPSSVEDAVARIRVWRTALQTISAVAEAQVMAACWVMRRQSRDRAAFERLVDDRLRGVLSVDRAEAMAKTWDVARRQRSVRALAMDSPGDAVLFVRDFTEAIPGDIEELDEDDRQIAALLAAPPRTRRARLRDMIQRRREAEGSEPRNGPGSGRSSVPAGWAARAGNSTSSAEAAPAIPAANSPASMLSRLSGVEIELAGIATAVEAHRSAWPRSMREPFLRAIDRAQAMLDRCACVGGDDDGRG